MIRRIINSRPLFLALAGVLLVGGSAGCFSGKRAVKRAEGYKVNPPKNWKKHSHGENDRAYKLPSGNLVAVTSSCERHPNADLHLLTRHLLIGTRHQVYKKQAMMQVNGVEALHSSVKAKLGSRRVHYEIVVLSKAKCIFDFTMVSKRNMAKSDVSQFLAFVKSFRYGKS